MDLSNTTSEPQPKVAEGRLHLLVDPRLSHHPDHDGMTKQWERRCRDEDDLDFDDYGGPFLPTEVGYATAVKVPRRPSKKYLRRFPRALKMLGLEPLSLVKKESSEASEDTKTEVAQVNLRLLVSNRDALDDV